jgi:hypothetical protein
MVREQELLAMSEIRRILEPLEAAEVQRVLAWAIAAHRHQSASSAATLAEATSSGGGSQSPSSTESIALMFDKANPKSSDDRILLTAFWIEQATKKTEWASFSINKELKNLGYAQSHIAEALTSLINKEPSLVRQTSKSGTTQQARKTYMLTEAGRKRVKLMLGVDQPAISTGTYA